ncbi:hypothetical protein ACIHCX_31195 [Streptomyces sp. NPDC052043]|uniref:hypothetical protein n=1 Tax=Streptomyces sp. NPDC052043 TaxID=3365684 RepID=UPI0037D2AB8A
MPGSDQLDASASVLDEELLGVEGWGAGPADVLDVVLGRYVRLLRSGVRTADPGARP